MYLNENNNIEIFNLSMLQNPYQHSIIINIEIFNLCLQQNPCQHPIIILRDVSYTDVSALLSFVYAGEVYVSQERLTAFLNTAELLHIKGLTDQNHAHNGWYFIFFFFFIKRYWVSRSQQCGTAAYQRHHRPKSGP